MSVFTLFHYATFRLLDDKLPARRSARWLLILSWRQTSLGHATMYQKISRYVSAKNVKSSQPVRRFARPTVPLLCRASASNWTAARTSSARAVAVVSGWQRGTRPACQHRVGG